MYINSREETFIFKTESSMLIHLNIVYFLTLCITRSITTSGCDLPKSIFLGFRADLKKGRFVINTTHPIYTLTGKYKGEGKILVLPIAGDGFFNATQSRIFLYTLLQSMLKFFFTGSRTRESILIRE